MGTLGATSAFGTEPTPLADFDRVFAARADEKNVIAERTAFHLKETRLALRSLTLEAFPGRHIISPMVYLVRYLAVR